MTVPSVTSNTCMRVQRAISSVRMLLWSGARCCTSTKAIPGSRSAGMAAKNASNAARPPADAPIPTTGKPGLSGSTGFCCSTSLVGTTAGSCAAAPFPGFLVVMGFTCCDGGECRTDVSVYCAKPSAGGWKLINGRSISATRAVFGARQCRLHLAASGMGGSPELAKIIDL